MIQSGAFGLPWIRPRSARSLMESVGALLVTAEAGCADEVGLTVAAAGALAATTGVSARALSEFLQALASATAETTIPSETNEGNMGNAVKDASERGHGAV